MSINRNEERSIRMSNVSFNNGLPADQSFAGIENRNFLSPVGFKFNIDKLKGVDFFCQSASVPSLSIGKSTQYTRFNDIPQPGDELEYEDLQLRFLIDENMKNYYQVHDWMRSIATPKKAEEFTYNRGSLESPHKRRNQRDVGVYGNQWKSDASLFILSSNYQPVAEFIFRDCWPTGLTTLTFDASVDRIEYFTAEISMAYSYFDYYIYDAATATDASMESTYRYSEEGATLS